MIVNTIHYNNRKYVSIDDLITTFQIDVNDLNGLIRERRDSFMERALIEIQKNMIEDTVDRLKYLRDNTIRNRYNESNR